MGINKFLAFAVGAAILVGIGVFFITQNPGLFERIINWTLSELGIS